jgi:hypothetical protein
LLEGIEGSSGAAVGNPVKLPSPQVYNKWIAAIGRRRVAGMVLFRFPIEWLIAGNIKWRDHGLSPIAG